MGGRSRAGRSAHVVWFLIEVNSIRGRGIRGLGFLTREHRHTQGLKGFRRVTVPFSSCFHLS